MEQGRGKLKFGKVTVRKHGLVLDSRLKIYKCLCSGGNHVTVRVNSLRRRLCS